MVKGPKYDETLSVCISGSIGCAGGGCGVIVEVEVVEVEGSSASVIAVTRGCGARGVSSPEAPGDTVTVGQSGGP